MLIEKDNLNIYNIKSLAFITSQAFSVYNFRGPLIRLLVDQGITVFALAPDYDAVSRGKVLELGANPIDFRLSRAGFNPIRDFFDSLHLLLVLRDLKVDAIFAYFIKPVIYGTLAAVIVGVKKRFAMIEGAGFVFNEYQSNSNLRILLRFIVTCLYRFSLHFADRVFFLNPDDKCLFIETGMVDRNKVTLLNGIGVDLDHFSTKPPVIQPVSFVMVARLLREKGVYDYVEAARLIKSMHPDVRFFLLGSVDANPESLSQAEIDAWQTEGLIVCPGHVSDVRDWIEHVSVFVLPSYYREGLPRSIMEAMAMGRPIITSDTVGCRETVEEGINGFKVPARSPNLLADAMMAFIQQPELISEMGAKSRQFAQNKYDVIKINMQILADLGIS
jgi:glycosyltransferase involved in cell wall biosynthesis